MRYKNPMMRCEWKGGNPDVPKIKEENDSLLEETGHLLREEYSGVSWDQVDGIVGGSRAYGAQSGRMMRVEGIDECTHAI